MSQCMLFIDRAGIRVDDQWITVNGRRVPVAAVREIVIREGRPGPMAHRVAVATAVLSTILVLLALQAESLVARLVVFFVVALALVTAICTMRLRPPSASLEAWYSGRSDLLVAASNATFVNQVSRAIIRACERCEVRPAAYRVYEPRRGIALLIVHLVALTFIATTLLAASVLNLWR